MPSRLPLFPLEVVLFPGTPPPLHIFEPRYRAMLADCVAGDERFGLLNRFHTTALGSRLWALGFRRSAAS